MCLVALGLPQTRAASHIVGVFAAVSVLVLLIGIYGFGLGGLLHFFFTGVASNVFVL